MKFGIICVSLVQLFAVLFFLMMAVLGVGSGVALLSTVNTVLLDSFPRIPTYILAAVTCSMGFLMGLVYVTPGGQYILELVDHYGGTFMRLFAAITETLGVAWIYGLENLCLDLEYMLGRKTSPYWRICWGIVTPVIMVTVFFYALVTVDRIKFGNVYVYPNEAYIAGSCLQYFGMALVPLCIVLALWKYRSNSFVTTVKTAFRKKPTYGPTNPIKKQEWHEFKRQAKQEQLHKRKNWFHHVLISLYGGYRRGRK